MPDANTPARRAAEELAHMCCATTAANSRAFRLFKFAKGIKWTYEMMVNDDLSVLQRLPDIAGRMRLGNSSKTASLFRRSVVAVLSRAYAGACHLLYAFLNWLASQRFVHSMEGEFLDAEGLMYDIPRKQAGYAGGVAEVAGNDGLTVALNTICQNDDGVQYTVLGHRKVVQFGHADSLYWCGNDKRVGFESY